MKRTAHLLSAVTALTLLLLSLVVVRAAVSPLDSGFTVQGWDNADGLPPNLITSLARTSDGYLWLGTSAGLVRFDGVRFVTLATNTIPALGDNRISCLHADRNGILWVGTQGGTLSKREAGVFSSVSISEKLRGIPITSFAQDSDGTLWLATRFVGVVRQRGRQSDFFGTTNGLPGNAVTHLTRDRQGKLWGISGAKLIALEQERWQEPAGLPALEGELVALAAAHDGGLWVATTHPQPLGNRGGMVFKLKEGRWETQLEPYLWAQDTIFTRLTTMLEDRDGRLWVGTPGAGVFVWDAESKWQRLATAGALAQLDCTAFVSDGEDGLWIGTSSGELFQARSRPVKTLHLPQIAEKNIVLNTFAARDGSVWIGTDGSGLFRLRDGEFTRYAEEQGLTNAHIGVIFEDSRTNLWVGTWNGLFRLTGERFKPAPGPRPLREVVLTLCEDRDGNLWAGTGGGVVKFGGAETKVFGKAEGVDHFYIRGITQDAQGRVWLAVMDRGLYLFQDGKFSRYGAGQWRNEALIRSLHAAKDGVLWIGTFGAGVVRLKDDEFTQWTTHDGLPNDRIVSIVADDSENLWFTSEDGIFGCPKTRFDNYQQGVTPQLLFWHMSMAEGLETKKCNGAGQPVIGRSADGRLWTPNWRALAVFDPAKIPRAWSMWPVLMEETLVDGKPLTPSADGSLRVKSGARSYEFHYTSANLRTPERMRFRYRLNGSDSDWVEADQRRTAYYGRLTPGEYEFNVMAGGPTGVWQESARSLRLTVEPLLWERRSVQVAGALALLGLVAATVWRIERGRSRRRLQMVEAQQAMERERRRIARDLHDDLGSDLTEIMLLGELAAQPAASADARRQHADAIAMRSRQAAAAMDEIVWTVNPRNDSVPRLADRVAEVARRLFEPLPVQLQVDLMEDIPALPLPATARHNLFLAAKEAQNNAARHSGADKVRVAVWCESGRLVVTVEDNGRAFDANRPNDSRNGLENMRQRMESIGGTFHIASQPGQGTKVRLEYPLPGGDSAK